MVFYESFYSSADELDDHEFRMAWKAICEYAFYGIEPENLPTAIKIFFKLIRPNIDKVIQAREGGQSGGRPKKPKVSEVKTLGFEGKNPRLLDEKPKVMNSKTSSIYDVDVDVDVDVDKDIDVDVDVEAAAEPKPKYNTTNIPRMTEISFESHKGGYNLSIESMQRFVEYNRAKGWKMDWKEALKKWYENEKAKPPEKKNFLNNSGKRTGEEKAQNEANKAKLIAMQGG